MAPGPEDERNTVNTRGGEDRGKPGQTAQQVQRQHRERSGRREDMGQGRGGRRARELERAGHGGRAGPEGEAESADAQSHGLAPRGTLTGELTGVGRSTHRPHRPCRPRDFYVDLFLPPSWFTHPSRARRAGRP